VVQSNQPLTMVDFPRTVFLRYALVESEASGSARATPVQQRRRLVPAKHPHHRRGRKVSAPPELQPHLTSHHTHLPTKGGAINNTSEPQDYVININSANNGLSPTNEAIYSISGSDSGVTSSEYSSYYIPQNNIGQRQKQRLPFEHNLTSPSGSIEDLLDDTDSKNTEKYYASDSEADSLGLSSPMANRRVGMSNLAYTNTENVGGPIVLTVGGQPSPNRSYGDNNIMNETPILSNPGTPQNSNMRERNNSMVLQLNLGNNVDHLPTGRNVSTMPMGGGRSISLISLNQVGVNTLPNINTYPNLNNYASDTQSIYSEIGGGPTYGTGYLGAQNIINTMGSQGSLAGYKDGTMKLNPADQEPESTSEEEKISWTVKTLANNASLLYGISLITLAIVIYFTDIFSGDSLPLAAFFNLFLIISQMVFLGFIHKDVRRYIRSITKAIDKNKNRNNITANNVIIDDPTGDPINNRAIHINVTHNQEIDQIPQSYGFTSGRHGGSFYLKIGALLFCLGSMIHLGLDLGQKIQYLLSPDPSFSRCTCASDIVIAVLQPIYVFYNLFFVFKFSNLIINKNVLRARLGAMHCICASLCFWIQAIMKETLQAIYSKKKKAAYYNATSPYTATTMSPLKMFMGKNDDDDDDDSDEMFDDDNAMLRKFQSYVYKKDIHGATQWNIHYGCEKTTSLTEMINVTTPYLYPFSIEYNILIVGFFILVLENIGKMDRHTHLPSVEVTYEEDQNTAPTREFSSNMIIYVDCHSSNRGLFAGLFMMISTIISIIFFFIFTANPDTVADGLMVKAISELLSLSVMIVAVLFAFNSIRHLDVLKHKISSVDDILLIICMPCILMYAFFNMVPSSIKSDWLFVIVYCMQVVQAIIQTLFIGDGLRRCSNSSALQQKKHGRELITFLVVSNVALWMLETFEIKNDAGNKDKYDFYGKNLWTLLSHMTLPLALFYRFHSSVCLADMWKGCYEQEEEH